LETCTLSAASPDGGLLTRSISRVAHEHDAVARSIFLGDEPIRPGPDGFGDWATWRRLSQPPWHHHRHHGARLRPGIPHKAKGFAQLQWESPGIDWLQRLGCPNQHPAQGVPRTPTTQACSAVLGRDRAAIMEGKPVSQSEGPGHAVGATIPALDHLRPRLPAVV